MSFPMIYNFVEMDPLHLNRVLDLLSNYLLEMDSLLDSIDCLLKMDSLLDSIDCLLDESLLHFNRY